MRPDSESQRAAKQKLLAPAAELPDRKRRWSSLLQEDRLTPISMTSKAIQAKATFPGAADSTALSTNLGVRQNVTVSVPVDVDSMTGGRGRCALPSDGFSLPRQ